MQRLEGLTIFFRLLPVRRGAGILVRAPERRGACAGRGSLSLLFIAHGAAA
jgi:hypothetical protein